MNFLKMGTGMGRARLWGLECKLPPSPSCTHTPPEKGSKLEVEYQKAENQLVSTNNIYACMQNNCRCICLACVAG